MAVGLGVAAEVDVVLLPPLLGPGVLPPVLGLGVDTVVVDKLPPVLGLGVTTAVVDKLPPVLGLGVNTVVVDKLPPVLPPAEGLDVLTTPSDTDDGLSVPEPTTDDDGLDAPPVLVSDGVGVDTTSSEGRVGDIVGH